MAEFSKNYADRSPADYLEQMRPAVLESLSAEQLAEVRRLLHRAIPRPTPKIIDLRFGVDLILGRFFVVLWVGKERRRAVRRYPQNGVTRAANAVAACGLLLGLNVLVTISLFLLAYLLKTASGIDLLPGHLPDYVRGVLK